MRPAEWFNNQVFTAESWVQLPEIEISRFHQLLMIPWLQEALQPLTGLQPLSVVLISTQVVQVAVPVIWMMASSLCGKQMGF